MNVYDYFNANNTGYIVMEYLDGENLNQFFRREGPIREFDRLYTLLRPVMEGLEKIHQAGLIHRDISPSNLMLLKSGKVKLLDFGTVRQISAEGELSLSVALKPGFAPVEQYQSHGRQGPWTDVYALCATIYKLMTGRTPYEQPERKGPLNPMDMGPSSVLVPPSQLGARISNIQEETLLQGLRERPEDRVRSVAQLMRGFDGKENPARKSTTSAGTDQPGASGGRAAFHGGEPTPSANRGGTQSETSNKSSAHAGPDTPPASSAASAPSQTKRKGRRNWNNILASLLAFGVVGYFKLINTDTHTHTWVDANCTAPKTCSVCGKTEGAALGHQWQEADYQNPKTCLSCGATEGDPLAINYYWSEDVRYFKNGNFYYRILENPLYDLNGITIQCCIQDVDGGSFGNEWYLWGLCDNENWEILGEFTMGEYGMNGTLEEHDIWFKQPQNLTAVTITPKTYSGNPSYRLSLLLVSFLYY